MKTKSQLAIEGGPKVRTAPWPVRRLFGEREKAAVTALLDRAIAEGSHLLGYNGEQEQKYCEEFAAWLGGGFADGVNSGTNAVYVALRTLDLPPGSEVIVPPVTDPGGVMPVALLNCVPVVADAAPGSYNTDAEQIAARLTPRTRAILVAHIAGIPCAMDAIVELARARRLPLIEDCAQAHGATWRGKPVGSFGDLAAFSTMFGKHHATGGQGGVVFTRDEQRYWRVRQLADRGKPFGLPAGRTNVVAALNCNMDELHACIGRVQLQRLPEMLARRRQVARRIEEGFSACTRTVRLLPVPPQAEPAPWFLFARLELDRLRVDKKTFRKAVAAEGVPEPGDGYWHLPMAYEWFAACGALAVAIPNITETNRACVTIPLHEDYTEREIEDLVAAFAKVEAAYRR